MPRTTIRPARPLLGRWRRSWRAATFGLARRFGMVQTLVVVVFALALGFVVDVVVSGRIENEVEQRALAMAAAQARLAGVHLADYRLEDLSIGLRDLRSTRGVMAARVVDEESRLLSDGDAGGALFAALHDPLIERARTAGVPVVELRDDRVRAAAPVFLGGPAMGAVCIDLSLADMHAQLAGLRRQIALVAAVFVVLGLVANAWLVGRTRRSLEALTNLTRIASDGDLSRRDIVRSNDEIQQLAIAFNRMLLRLRQSTVSRDYVNHIIQSMSEALLVVDREGRVSLANRAACRLFDYSERALHRKKLKKLVCGETTSPDDLLAGAAVAAPLETRVLTRHDARIPVLWSASPLPDGGTVCLAQDLRVRKLAYFDSVTELPNRVQFKQELARAVSEASRQQTKMAVLFVDLDHFKMINDSYGHDVGDRLLRSVADRLQGVLQCDEVVACCSAAPMLARLGGDEFTILAPGIRTNAEVAEVADHLLTALAIPFELGERSVLVAASIGIALFPEHGVEPETLIQNADRAMYWAKERGRNAARFFETTMENAANERLELENELRRAVHNAALCVYYQPQIDIPTGRVMGCEALLRWHHPKLGAISPGRFIPIAETSGLIIPIDRWVLQTACAQLARWGRQGLGDLRIAVNVTALTLQQEDFVGFVLDALTASSVSPSKLEIEITERAAVSDLDDTIAKLHRLRRAGVQIAIDDFGTGYSSLSYLKRLPADRLKIDRSFVRDADRNATDRALFRAIVDMASAVGMQILAEGVETAEQLAFLRQEGCQGYQGFFMSPAIAVDDVLPWLLERDLAPMPARSSPPPSGGQSAVSSAKPKRPTPKPELVDA